MDSHFQEMSINGSFMANNINVTGDVSVQGSFLAKNSNFKNIEVTSEKITLDNCSAGEIKVNNSSDQDQIVEVKGKSRIQKITFVSNRGIVKKNSESTVEVVSGEKLQ
jgi:hypothetical protein